MTSSIHPENNRITIKGLKTGPSLEYGPKGSFTCTVYFDNKKVSKIFEEGNGGCLNVDVIDAAQNEKMMAYFNESVLPLNPPRDMQGIEIALSIDMYFYAVVEKFEDDRRLKRMCKTKTLVITKDCADGEMYVSKCKFDTNVKQQIVDKHGEDLVEIVNERFIA